jgi:hypothetical protein
MLKHKKEDYILSAVKYYFNNDVSLDDICKIFDYSWFNYFLIKII